LRRLLGGENLVRYRAGQLSIDSSSCWVDAAVLDHVIGTKSRTDQIIPFCRKAVALYKGPFLPSDANLPWTARRRETLKNGLLRAITLAGAHAEQAGQWQEAAEYYRSGLEADDLAEEFYRRLMACYQKLGNFAGAARTYERCRKQLHENLGVGPSYETEAVYSSLPRTP
jgi:two-component SAPR family response regulator